MLARAAAEDVDESGALGLSTIVDIGKGLWDAGKALFGSGYIGASPILKSY